MSAQISTTTITASNSLADLAARINAEHEAASTFMQQGLERAIRAGELLIEAKAQLAHGHWLPWLREHCHVPERTVQAYMRVARSFTKLDDEKRNAVADLSFRDALRSLSTPDLILDQTARRARIETIRARNAGALDTPASMLPSPKGRKIRVARNPAERGWMLAIGPSVTRAALIEKEEAARGSPAVQELQLDKDELLERAAALEAEAKALREGAESVQSQISGEIKKALGPVSAFTETYNFQADEATDSELAGLPQQDLIDRLLAARGAVSEGLEQTERGYWGDLRHMGHLTHSSGGGGKGWTKIGSPEWLDALFPNWNQDAKANDEVVHAAAAGVVS